ncbi:MAG: hypothetical protein J3Q66DRAFT_71215 [Benniella sp.]|nr:MAG: hypothetical protein J3Q66DRAFT_71215 [Benniella sp.]
MPRCHHPILEVAHPSIRWNRISSLVSICKAWKPHLRKQIEQLLGMLLPTNRITWVPINHSTKEANPLAIILETAQKQSSALGTARIIMDYCVEHAHRSRNLAFLPPFFDCLRDIMKMYPDEAFLYLKRIAFIPVMNRSYLLDNSIVVPPPSFRWKFWKPNKIPFYKLRDQVFQLRVSTEDPDPDNEKFTHPVFMASFDTLWRRQDPKVTRLVKRNGSTVIRTTWQKSLLQMILLKMQLKSHSYVKAYNFSIEFYDNPAIAALVAFKWNTIGYWYWFGRFFFQSCFYVIVVMASIMQVYWEHAGQLSGVFLAIAFMASVFLWLELRQIIAGAKRYARSGYNFLDVLAFSFPLAASIRHLIVVQPGDVQDSTQILSFSVLAVFLHIVFELRIFKSVCKFVTIIQQAVAEIRVFFVIFAGGLIAFAVATLHLLRACTHDECQPPETGFPSNFWGALLSMYFFMNGRWDPVSKDFESENWGFHIMMAIFSFVTTILMLNVLIALINVAFNKGDDGWRLVWIESQLRYIEAAEDMSYHIPGFRQTYDFFPDVIYFSATYEQVREITSKLDKRKCEIMDLDMAEKWLGEEDDDALEANNEDLALEEEPKEREGSVDPYNNNNGGSIEDVLEPQVENLTVTDCEVLGNTIEPRQRKGQSVFTTEGTPSIRHDSQDREFTSLSKQVEDLQRLVNSEVKDLHQQVANLQQQVERQFEELKGFLLQHSVG